MTNRSMTSPSTNSEELNDSGQRQGMDNTLPFNLTQHAQRRMDSRRISLEAIDAVLTHGRRIWARGAQIFAIGNKEVLHGARHGFDLRSFAGLQVVCTPEGVILTAYRNHDFHNLRKTA